MVTVAEEEVYVVQYSGKSLVVDSEPDSFAKLNAEEVKSLENIHPNAKKRIVRKYMRGSDGTSSKSKEPLAETAYDIFEVAIPPHNLTHLSKH